MGCNQQRFALCRKATRHIALGIEHQHTVPANDRLSNEMQHGLRFLFFLNHNTADPTVSEKILPRQNYAAVR